ncbi:MAG: hypothetical protein ACJ8G7_20530 [Rhizobacter sp.]
MAPRNSPGLASRHVAERFPVDGGTATVRRRLRSLLQARPGRYDRVIFCDEEMIGAIARHLDEPWAAACFPVAPGPAAAMVSRKTAFIAACQRAGIGIPESFVCQRPEEALAAGERIGFPLLLKADFGASGTTVWRVDGSAELIDALPRMARRPFVVQALIVGEAGVTEMLCVRGRAIAVVSSVMQGIEPMPFGTASSRLYRKNPEAEAIAVKLAALTGFHGLCGFDWMRSALDGRTHALEFHARPTLGFHMARHAGVDFAKAIAATVGSSDSIAIEQPADLARTCYFFPKDFTRVLAAADVRGLLRWMSGRSINDLPWADPGLLWALAARFGRARLRWGIVSRPERFDQPARLSTAFGDDL